MKETAYRGITLAVQLFYLALLVSALRSCVS
jgi:hypothetical protein